MKLAEIIAAVVNTIERVNNTVNMIEAPASQRTHEPLGVAFVYYSGATQLIVSKDGRVWEGRYNEYDHSLVMTPVKMHWEGYSHAATE